MAASEQNPSPTLLRLRPADVVRLCGLNAAATGLELATNHNVIASTREGSRLQSTVNDGSLRQAWVEIPDEMDSARWACDCGQTGPFACAHVAATLSAWIAHPTDFAATNAEPSETRADDSPARPAPPGDTSPTRESPHGRLNTHDRSAPPLTATLSAALARMNVADVATIARRLSGTDVTDDTEDADTARLIIIAILSDPIRLRSLLDRLDSSARSLLILVDLAGGAITSADLEALAARIGRPLSAVQSDVAVLERHALLLPMLPTGAPSEHGRGSSWRHVAGWRVPQEVRRAFGAPLPLDALPTPDGSPFAPPLPVPHAPALHVLRGVPRMLCLAIALLADAPPPLGLRRPARASDDTSAMARQGNGIATLAPDDLAPQRLKELAQGAGLEQTAIRLARRILGQLRERQHTPPIAALSRLPATERPVVLRDAFRHWLRGDSAAELLDIESPNSGVRIRSATAHPGFQPEAIAREVSDGKRFIASLLCRVQPGTWYALESFATLVWQARPGLLRGQQQSWATPAWWLESADGRPLGLQVRDDWMIGEGAFIRSLLSGALFVWGAVDLATREDGAIVAFRVTPFGEFLLRYEMGEADSSLAALCDGDWGPPVLPLREGTLAVQPLAAGSALLDALALWAAPTAVSGKRLIYRLSADRACAAFDQHRSPDTLPTMLQPLHSRAAERVAGQLHRWHAAWGHSRLTTGYTLLEAGDEASLMEALACAPEIAARCRQIGPALALALPEDAAALRSLLAKRGYAV